MVVLFVFSSLMSKRHYLHKELRACINKYPRFSQLKFSRQMASPSYSNIVFLCMLPWNISKFLEFVLVFFFVHSWYCCRLSTAFFAFQFGSYGLLPNKWLHNERLTLDHLWTFYYAMLATITYKKKLLDRNTKLCVKGVREKKACLCSVMERYSSLFATGKKIKRSFFYGNV